jgi:hypothetical protein
MSKTKQIKMKHYGPAAAAVILFGGVNELGRLLGISGSNVSRWRTSPHTGGMIPNTYYAKILSMAEELGVDFTATDLVKGKVLPVTPDRKF